MLFRSLTDDEIHQIALDSARATFSGFKLKRANAIVMKNCITLFKLSTINFCLAEYHSSFHHLTSIDDLDGIMPTVKKVAQMLSLQESKALIWLLYLKWLFVMRQRSLQVLLENSADLIQGEVIAQPLPTFVKAVLAFQLETYHGLPEWSPEFDSAEFWQSLS
ncbi:TPA: hypothetical protein PXG50_000826 [Mannheimia haemolytica]|nr:hypothetical protein [Mannheimia haemolytica]